MAAGPPYSPLSLLGVRDDTLVVPGPNRGSREIKVRHARGNNLGGGSPVPMFLSYCVWSRSAGGSLSASVAAKTVHGWRRRVGSRGHGGVAAFAASSRFGPLKWRVLEFLKRERG